MVDFELIKGKIQKHRLSSIIYNCLELLNEVQRRDDKGFPIWNIYALIKWSYLHTSDSILRKPIQTHEFNQLLTLIRDFEVKYNGISFKNKGEVNQSFKIIAFQQFAHQDTFNNAVLSRQIILFLKLKSKLNITLEFKRITGMELKSFLEYCYFTFFFFHFDKLGMENIKYGGELFESYFVLFKLKWNEIELKKFLNLISIKERKDVEKLHKLKSEIMQLYETNFFTTKPLLLFRNEYRIPHPSIFIQTLKYFVYNFLKENSEKFPEEFGKRLEQYIQLGLVENKLSFLTETALKNKYRLGKVSDFLVEADILIDAKAIELHPRSGVMRTREILMSDLDSTITKAYIQLLSTANAINPNKEWFGIVITYKEMYLGFGADAWEEFLKEPIEKYCNESSIPISLLPPANLCFINIEDWDYIMQAVKDGKASLKEILIKARDCNANPNIIEKVMIMEQILNKHYSSSSITLSYLKDTYLELDILPERNSF